mgnify:CR=1 FL=1
MVDENEVWINEDVARRYSLKSGDYVRLKNTEGITSSSVKVKATQRIRGDCVYMVHGFGQKARGIFPQYKKGANDAQLITHYKTDPLMGATGMSVNFVTLDLEG